ncbi:MAG: hypothetical protein LIP15_07565 [Clostridium sp.]|nr:hypothetical protein [Clostridium sp.]
MANENLAILKVDGLVIDFSEQSVTYMNEEASCGFTTHLLSVCIIS